MYAYSGMDVDRVQRPTKWAKIELPIEFKIGLEGMAKLANWRIRRTAGGFEVATEERYKNRSPDLLRLERIADSTNSSDAAAYDKFRSWLPQDGLATSELRSKVAQMKEVTNPESSTEAWVNFRMRFSTMPDRELGPYLADLFPDIVEQIPTASLWALHFDPSLSWRVAAVRVLFAAQASPEILQDWSHG
jgi:hypothetical protein